MRRREGRAPEAWVRFREAIRSADAVLFVTPEYNRSVPGVLRMAMATSVRAPMARAPGAAKPAAIISISPGALGAFGANHHLRQALVFLDMPTLQQPEAYIGQVATLFDVAGGIAKEETAKS